MPNPSIPKLRFPIVIESYPTGDNQPQGSFGDAQKNYVAFANRRAEITELGGTETEQGKQLVAQRHYRFRFRYLDGMSPLWRIVWDGRIFNVESVTYDPLKSFTTCETTEKIVQTKYFHEVAQGGMVAE